ncbi:MAG: transposase [Anaerolineales bacterium]|nr:MAG: transposase [Anaerolineales bacterium]
MQHIIKPPFAQLRFWQGLVLFSILVLALLGQTPDSQCGWLTCPPRVPSLPAMYRRRRRLRSGLSLRGRLPSLWHYVTHSWPQPMVRSFLLALFWSLSGRQGPAGLMAWPWLVWLWQVVAAGWPELSQRRIWRGSHWLLWQGQRLLVVGYLGLTLRQFRPLASQGTETCMPVHCLFLGLGCQSCGREEPWVEVIREEDGGYLATLCGHFAIQVSGDHPFRARMLMLFLAWLDVPGYHRRSRRTRDGRTPFVRQRQLSEWFELPQPDVSRIAGYWHQAAWPELLSQCTSEILTPGLIRRIVTICATHPHWNQEEVYQHLQGQKVLASRRQVRQAMEQSGWSTLRQELKRRYHWTPDTFRLRKGWLVQELFRQIHVLHDCLDRSQQLPVEEQMALLDLRALAREGGKEFAPPPLKALPWLLQVEQILFRQWVQVQDDTIRCPECNSVHVVRKSRKPRMKKYYDAQGKLQEVPVVRYYCRNRDCSRGSFTHLPPGLVPYSRHRLEVRLKAVQTYSWSYSTYRRVGQALQVSEMTIYRWVSAWGHDLLPVVALFGLVRSSGVIGVDEKFVLVPKNDKPAGKMRRWMYVYLAVDVYTYDLLHIAIYPHNTHHSAHAFLLALKVKGYRPGVVVTDLRQDYGPIIAQVFPQAQHHECLFHAMQDISRYLRTTWGRDYAEQHPEVEQVRQAVVRIFQVRTKRTAQKRYQALLDQRDKYIQREPALQWVFDFLERHWPCLINAVESDLIPKTNNAVEMVIRRFDQHYQNFCGFESIETAKVYLGVFEKIYRFTPFSRDARPEIRGKSPLQLAGYDLSRVPMACLCRGYSLEWPLEIETADVPNL